MRTGPHSPLASLPVRQYMDAAVVPTLREGLRALNEARPPDALLFLSDYLLKARDNARDSANHDPSA